MKILGIIPARYASTRLPGKPLVDIGGKTMIRRVYEQAMKASSLYKVIVATDDSRIADEVLSWDGLVMITSTNHVNGTERCAEVLDLINEPIDAVINIQGDEPFINPEQINTVASLVQMPDVQIATLIKICNDRVLLENPSIIKAVVNSKMEALYFSRSVVPYLRDITVSHTFYKHIGIYGFQAAILKQVVLLPHSTLERAESLEQLRWLENGHKIQTAISEFESISIDTAADLERAKEYL